MCDEGPGSTGEEDTDEGGVLALTTQTGTTVLLPYDNEVSLGDVASRILQVDVFAWSEPHRHGRLIYGKHVFSHTEFKRTVEEAVENVDSGSSSPSFHWSSSKASSLQETGSNGTDWGVTQKNVFLLETLDGRRVTRTFDKEFTVGGVVSLVLHEDVFDLGNRRRDGRLLHDRRVFTRHEFQTRVCDLVDAVGGPEQRVRFTWIFVKGAEYCGTCGKFLDQPGEHVTYCFKCHCALCRKCTRWQDGKFSGPETLCQGCMTAARFRLVLESP